MTMTMTMPSTAGTISIPQHNSLCFWLDPFTTLNNALHATLERTAQQLRDATTYLSSITSSDAATEDVPPRTNSISADVSISEALVDAMAKSAVLELDEYRNFTFGWDGYSGSPFDSRLVDIAQGITQYIGALCKKANRVPQELTPGPVSDGSIDIEVAVGSNYAIFSLEPGLEALNILVRNNQGCSEEKIQPDWATLRTKIAALFTD
jgi:hypothetical protein